MAFIHSKKESTKKIYIFFGLSLIICFLLTSGIVSFLAKEKNMPVPNLMLCLTVLTACYLETKPSCVFAVVSGFICDLFIFDSLSFSPIVFLLGVYFATKVLHFFSRPGTLAMAVCVLPCLAARMVIDTVIYYVKFDGVSVFTILTNATAFQVIIDFAAAIVVSFTIKRLYFRFFNFLRCR